MSCCRIVAKFTLLVSNFILGALALAGIVGIILCYWEAFISTLIDTPALIAVVSGLAGVLLFSILGCRSTSKSSRCSGLLYILLNLALLAGSVFITGYMLGYVLQLRKVDGIDFAISHSKVDRSHVVSDVLGEMQDVYYNLYETGSCQGGSITNYEMMMPFIDATWSRVSCPRNHKIEKTLRAFESTPKNEGEFSAWKECMGEEGVSPSDFNSAQKQGSWCRANARVMANIQTVTRGVLLGAAAMTAFLFGILIASFIVLCTRRRVRKQPPLHKQVEIGTPVRPGQQSVVYA